MSQPQPAADVSPPSALDALMTRQLSQKEYEKLTSVERVIYDSFYSGKTPDEETRHQLEQHNLRMRKEFLRRRPKCISRLTMYVYRQEMYRLPDISYWRKFVEDFYDLEAVEKWCFAVCNNVEIHGVFNEMFENPFCRVNSDARQCKMCGSCSKRHYEATTKSLPPLLKSKYESGMVSDLLYLMDVPQGKILSDGNTLLEYKEVVRKMDYRYFTIFYKGKLRLIFTKDDAKIKSWEFCAQRLQVYVPASWIPEPHTNVEVGTGPYEGHLLISSAVFLAHMARENINIGSHITSWGLPQSYHRCFQMIETFHDTMKHLMDYCILTGSQPVGSLYRLVANKGK